MMVKITYRMKIHCIDIPTQSVETRKNTPLPLSRGESENPLFGGDFNSFQLVPMLCVGTQHLTLRVLL